MLPVIPGIIVGAESVNTNYVDASGTTQTAECILIESCEAGLNLTDGWYVARGDITVSGKITVSGNVNIVLEDMCSFRADSGIALSSDGNTKLTVFGQKDGSGDLVAKGVNNCAGISVTDAQLEINGGNIEAVGGKNSAGIGGNYNKAMGTVTVNGGNIKATGGQYGAGIGGGSYAGGGSITVNRGVVKAVGGLYGAGIGGGNYGKGSDVTVNLGVVIATGGKNASGIGGGNFAEGGNVTVNGGIVKAVSEIFAETNVHHIGGGIYAGETPGTKTFNGGLVYEGTNKTWHSDTVCLSENYEIPLGESFTVEEGKTFEISESGYLINKGTFINNGTLLNKGGLYNLGTYTNNGTLNCFTTADAHPEKNSDGVYCSQCGVGDRVFKIDGIYQVRTASELVWVAKNINELQETSVRIKLLDDIEINEDADWTAFDSDYSIEFDGNGKTITMSKTDWSDYSYDAGLFNRLVNSVVKNLVLEGQIEHHPSGTLGAVTGYMKNSRIENVISYLDIKAAKIPTYNTMVGGLAGVIEGDKNLITNCAVYGSMDINLRGYVGGMVGEVNGSVVIENSACYLTEVTGGLGVAVDMKVGYLVGYGNGEDVILRNIWYVSPSQTRVIITDVCHSGSAELDNVNEVEEDKFTSGEVTWLLNGGVTDGSQAWYQICRKGLPAHSGETVYKGYYSCRSTANEEISNTFLYPVKPDHSWDSPCDEQCNLCMETRVVEEHSFKNGMCTKCGIGRFEISTADDLLWFSEFVNGGMYNVDARLTNNIDFGGGELVPIAGTSPDSENETGYMGTFDGNGHTISNVRLSVPDEPMSVGLFGTLGGTVSKLGVENISFSDTSNYYNLGGIAGQLTESGIIKNSYVANSTLKASPSTGGIAGLCEGTIDSCHTFGLNLGGALNRHGGICGDWPTGKITNCYTDFVLLGSTAAGKVGVADSLSEKSVSKSRFESGEIAWLLNNKQSGGMFKQKKGANSYPAFEGYELVVADGTFDVVYNDFDILSVNINDKTAAVVIPVEGIYTLIVADYENEELINLKEITLGNITGKQTVGFDCDFEINSGDSIMLWKSTSDDVTPLCRSYKVN